MEIDKQLISNILIIEDEIIVAENIAYILRKKGDFNFYFTDNKKEALQLFNEIEIQLIISDIHLGDDEDGIEIVEAIHLIKWVPIIYITAYSQKSDIDAAVKTEPIIYLIKPFLEQQLNVAFTFALEKANQVGIGKTILKPQKREIQIIEMLFKGHNSRDIGNHLNISEHTVKTHRKNLIKKYKVGSTYELIALASRLNWIK